MRKFLLAAACVFALPASSFAADMPAKAAPMAAAPVFNWTGFYLGVEGGGGWADTNHRNTLGGVGTGFTRIHGGLAGGTYGYNWQPYGSNVVFGLEGDISWSGIRKAFPDANGLGFCSPSPILCVTDLRWLGTDRVRLGVAQGPLLIYGTAGVAYGDVTGTILNAGFDIGSKLHSGLTAGGGVEWAFAPNSSLKVEYLWADLGSKVTYGITETVSLKNLNIVRVGLNYRFDWGKAPVVAKY